jgi:hypothetical protein
MVFLNLFPDFEAKEVGFNLAALLIVASFFHMINNML